MENLQTIRVTEIKEIPFKQMYFYLKVKRFKNKPNIPLPNLYLVTKLEELKNALNPQPIIVMLEASLSVSLIIYQI